MIYCTDEELSALDSYLESLCEEPDWLNSPVGDPMVEPDVVSSGPFETPVFEAPQQERDESGPLRRVPQGTQKSKGWCFTLNNPIMTGETLFELIKRDHRVRYCVFQLEAGEQGTRHFQGYLFFGPEAVRMSAVLSLFGDSWPHIEKAKGTPMQNKAYCTKEPRLGGPWTFGECPRSGQRTDLQALAQKAIAGESVRQMCKDDPYGAGRFANGLKMLSRYADPPELFRDVEVRLYVGPTGAGKTFAALAKSGYAENDIYVKGTDQWFDNYYGQPCVVLDDFAGSASKIALAETLRLLDRYRYQVQVKGGFEWFKPKLVIVTSNLHPHLWYDWSKREAQYKALQRRFQRVVLFREPVAQDMQGNCEVNQWGFVEEPVGGDYWVNWEKHC